MVHRARFTSVWIGNLDCLSKMVAIKPDSKRRQAGPQFLLSIGDWTRYNREQFVTSRQV